MDRSAYEQLDRMEHKINQLIEGMGMVMQRLDEETEDGIADHEIPPEERVVNPPKKEKEVNPEDEYKQK